MNKSETPNWELGQMDLVFLIARNPGESRILPKCDKNHPYDLLVWVIGWSSRARDVIQGATGRLSPEGNLQIIKAQENQKP